MEQTVNCILVIMDQTCDYSEFLKYLRKLRVRYPEAEVMTFSPSNYDKSEARRRENYKELLNTYGEDTRFAIHAQGAVGAMIAFEILNFEPERIDTVLFSVGLVLQICILSSAGLADSNCLNRRSKSRSVSCIVRPCAGSRILSASVYQTTRLRRLNTGSLIAMRNAITFPRDTMRIMPTNPSPPCNNGMILA